MDKTPYSECCGTDMPDYPDSDFCPSCGEHTGVEYEEAKVADDPCDLDCHKNMNQ